MTTMTWDDGRLVLRTGDRRMSFLVSAYDSVTPLQRSEIAVRLLGYARDSGHRLTYDQTREFLSRFD